MLKEMRQAEEDNGTSSFWKTIDVLMKIGIVVLLPAGSYFILQQNSQDSRITVVETQQKNDATQMKKIEEKVDKSLEKNTQIIEVVGRIDERIKNMERRNATD